MSITIYIFVASELKSIGEETSEAMNHLWALGQQIDAHEVELNQMIDGLTADQMESLRTTVEDLWGKSYSKEVFKKSSSCASCAFCASCVKNNPITDNPFQYSAEEVLREARYETVEVSSRFDSFFNPVNH